MREVRDAYCSSLDSLLRHALLDSDRAVRLTGAEVVAEHRLPMTALLVPWLSEDDPETRLVAVRVLERVFEPNAEDALARACRDEDTRVRKAAVRALARYPGALAAGGVIVALGDMDAEVRRVAAEVLARRDDANAMHALVAHGMDSDEGVRASILLALGVISSSTAPSAIESGLRDPAARVRMAAADAVAFPGVVKSDERIRSGLLSLVADEQPLFVVTAALGVLLRGDDNRRLGEGVFAQWLQLSPGATRVAVAKQIRQTEELADHFPEWCLEHPNVASWQECLEFYGSGTHDARSLINLADGGRVDTAAAIRTLARVSDPTQIDWVLGVLGSDDPRVVGAALDALEPMLEVQGSGRALDPLLLVLRRSRPGSPQRKTVVRLIGMTRSPRAWPALDAVLSDEKTHKGELVAAIEALGLIAHPRRGKRLVELLEHGERDASRAAARELFVLPETDVLPALLERLRRGSSRREELMIAISGMLSRTRDWEALSRGVHHLEQLEGAARDAVLEGLARNPGLDAQRAVEDLAARGSRADRAKIAEGLCSGTVSRRLLSRMAHDSDGRVRANAVWSLGRIGTWREADAVQSACLDMRLDVLGNAVVALGRIAGRSRRDVSRVLCPFANHRASQIRQAAMLGLVAAQQRCKSGEERALLLDDPDARVRRAAARVLSMSVGKDRPSSRDEQALRWCWAFERTDSVRQECQKSWSLRPTNEARAGDSRQGALVFVSADNGRATSVGQIAVGFERPDGLVRQAHTDRRGALFEPDCTPKGARLLLPIALDP